MSSGAIIPARAPASIDMLQMVSRPSIESARIGAPAYSRTCPTAPPTPIAADRAEDDVLRRDPERQLARVEDPHRLRMQPRKALRREHVLDLGRPDAEGERAERTVRRGVAVAADDRQARLREAELRPDHVDDALAPAARRVERDAELLAVRAQRVELGTRERIGDRPRERRDVVVHRRDREVGAAHRSAGEPQPVERLRRRHLVDQVQVDVEERGLARRLVDDVALPDPVEQRLRHRETVALSGGSWPRAPARSV